MSDKNNTNNDLLALSTIVGGLLASGHYTEYDEEWDCPEVRLEQCEDDDANPLVMRHIPFAVTEGISILNHLKKHLKECESEEVRRFAFIKGEPADEYDLSVAVAGAEFLARFEEHLKTKGVENFSYSDFLKMASEKGIPFPDESTYYALFEEWCDGGKEG